MFLRLPFESVISLHPLVIMLTTLTLLITLVGLELAYTELPQTERKRLRNFYPLLLILVCLILYASYSQLGKK